MPLAGHLTLVKEAHGPPCYKDLGECTEMKKDWLAVNGQALHLAGHDHRCMKNRGYVILTPKG